MTTSGGVNIKTMSQTQMGTGISSSLPLPPSMMPLFKMEPKHQYSAIPNPTASFQRRTKTQPPYSSSSVSSIPHVMLRGTALKSHLLQQKGGVYTPRTPAATVRANGTCSAYSSPQVPKREAPHSKDTLDLRTSALAQRAVSDLHVRGNTNKNWTFGKHRHGSVDNAVEEVAVNRLSGDAPSGHSRGRLPHTKGRNGNVIPGGSSTGLGTARDMGNLLNREMGTSEGEMSNNRSKSSYHSQSCKSQTLNMPHRGSEPSRVNMATVAPFRFR